MQVLVDLIKVQASLIICDLQRYGGLYTFCQLVNSDGPELKQVKFIYAGKIKGTIRCGSGMGK